jgi:hypothetical protein
MFKKIIVGIAVLIAINTAKAEGWSFNEFNDLNNGYNEYRLSAHSKDLTTSLEFICNKYGAQLLLTFTGWRPAFYEKNVSWIADLKQGGILDMTPTDSTAGLRGTWQAITSEQPKNLLNAINSSNSLNFRFKIAGKFKNKILDTTGAENSAAKFLDACLL